MKSYLNKILKGKVISISISILSLCIALFIYVFTRTTDLYIYDWLEINSLIHNIQNHFNYQFPQYIKYNLPDALWLFSYLMLLHAIWNDSKSKIKLIFAGMFCLCAIISEIFQYYHWILGTFDPIDILSYIGVSILYFFIIN